MMFPNLISPLSRLLSLFTLCLILCTAVPMQSFGATKVSYDLVYVMTNDLERVLDYKEEIESYFSQQIRRKIKIVSNGNEYALIYDANESARNINKILISHAQLLRNAGFDEPYVAKKENFHSLYNVCYGMGPNIEPLKKRYELILACLGEDVKKDLFIEKTDFGNYKLIYRRRGDHASTASVAKAHGKILRSRKIKPTLTREFNNPIVFGETNLFDEGGGGDKPEVCAIAEHEKTEVSEPARTPKNADAPIQKIEATPKIVKIPEAKSPVFVTAAVSRFENTIEGYIDELRRKGKIANDELTGWMVYDLERDVSLVDINANQAFQAASMIKPFVALAFFHQAKEGKLKYGSSSRRKMEAMIQRSSNSATNWIMKQAGGPAQCDAILRQYYSHIFKNTAIREYIPANGRTYLNSAPPADYVRFLRALWNMELPYGKEIRRLMGLPGRDRLYHGTPIPRGTLVYNKTGTTAHLCGDMGILVPKTKKGGRYPYAIVGIIERRSRAENYGQWMNSRSRVIREVSTLVYEELKKEHQLL
jgi:beta-lactamase class A